MASNLLEATETFFYDTDGVTTKVASGEIAHPSSEVAKRYPNAFKPVEVKYPAVGGRSVEQATAKPGEKRTTTIEKG